VTVLASLQPMSMISTLQGCCWRCGPVCQSWLWACSGCGRI